MGEREVLEALRGIARQNRPLKSMIGAGYHQAAMPAAIRRHILENPRWYTPYTPYQAEVAQGRLEALLNFQTMVTDLTGLEIANASLLDEATAAAEAMSMCVAITRRERFLIDAACHPQTIAVVQTRGRSMGVAIDVVDLESGIGNWGPGKSGIWHLASGMSDASDGEAASSSGSDIPDPTVPDPRF